MDAHRSPWLIDSTAKISAVEQVRIDNWQWAARFFKTPEAATEAVLSGHVHAGGERIRPATEAQAVDTIEIGRVELRRTVGLVEGRGLASVAAMLYEETSESIAARERQLLDRASRDCSARISAPGRRSRRSAGSKRCGLQ